MYSFRELMARFKSPAYSVQPMGLLDFIFVYTVPRKNGDRL